VTEATQRVIGKENRHGYIVNTMYSRSLNGKFKTKRDYKVTDINMILKMKSRLRHHREQKQVAF